MRCPVCNSYIPQGLESATFCPSCGKPLASAPSEPTMKTSESPKPLASPSAPAFAPFFTIKTQLAFGPTMMQPDIGLGSISFGPEGFSIVSSAGKSWKKIPYTDMSFLRQDGPKVLFETASVESKIEFPDSILANGADRAKIVLDILEKLKGRPRLLENPFSDRLSEEIERRMK